ncbi:coiled-coil domain-containing protein AGAP005037 isoform X6 [Nilaparvata lugens]|uniref:coiled-coil domain-containing protein AGAP005037 isoform X6 n=1 Tax=Nilaparvata lugens TaxID=108931 RepID=UPI00193E568E|nr:coiled-coil domain-containing protein AGAP005037 isoform X6 [Nilaparvata lugens]
MRGVAAVSNNGAVKNDNIARNNGNGPEAVAQGGSGGTGSVIAAFFVNKFRRNRQRFTNSDGNNNSNGGGVRRGIVRRRESPRRSQEVKVVVVPEGDTSSSVSSVSASSESLESVDPEIVEKFIEEVEYYRRCNVVDGVIYADKTGPTVETVQTPEKKKVGGIRRLLTPTLFSGDGRRSKVGQLDKRNGDASPGKAPVIETAFVGDERRSKSVSPCRFEPRYGVPKTRPSQELTVDTGRPPSAASTISSTSTSTLVTPQTSPSYRDRDRLLILSRNNNNEKSGTSSPLPNSPNKIRPRFYSIESPVRYTDNNVIKPQPLYNSTTPRRPRSVSPDTAASSPDYFIRGAGHRNTIGSTVRARQSTIYEEVDDAGLHLAADKSVKRFDSSTGSGTGKRVSFSPNRQQEIYWPTRKGPSVEPPTRRGGGEVSSAAPDRPLPPVPRPRGTGEYGRLPPPANQPVTRRVQALANRWQHQSESESGSEAGEIQRILHNTYYKFQEEEWSGEGKGRGQQNSDQQGGQGREREEESRKSNRARRDDPRRHTLSGDHHHNYPSALARSMDLEMGSKTQRRKSPLPRGYPPPSTAMLFDDDPGIMSEVETASTGFRRGNKQRSSLPVVRTPSKTLERPLGPGGGGMVMGRPQPPMAMGPGPGPPGHPPASRKYVSLDPNFHNHPGFCGLVFLQYRSETKRALLPNEITSIDTVKALFVRSFPKQLTMEYLDSPHVKIYIHDSSKDMFYELEDLRSHLRDIRDRSVLRLFESSDVSGAGAGGGVSGAGMAVPPPTWDQDQSYFSEPEFDSEYQHQHIHKTKGSKSAVGGHQPYYMTHSFPPGGATLPRGGPLLRTYSPAVPGPPKPPTDAGYMSSPERGGSAPGRVYPAPYVSPGAAGPYEDPYYSQYGSRTGSITPVIDEEASDTELIDESYSLYGVKLPVPRAGGQFPPGPPVHPPYDATRIRVEHMERQLANLTGLVQKALTQAPPTTPREFLSVPPGSNSNYRNANDDYDKHSSSSSASLPDETYVRSDTKPPKLGRVDTKPTKPAIKSSTLPRTSSQDSSSERDRHKPAPPPKPVSLSPGQYEGRHVYRDLQLTPEMYNQLRGLQKKAKDLRQEMRNLRRMSQAQAHSVRETMKDTFIKIRAMLMTGGEGIWSAAGDAERSRLNREEDLYKQEMLRLESDLTELESTVEELRGNVINRKTRVNMSDVENMALILSKSSKTVAELKLRFPSLQDAMRSLLSQEMEKVVCEEKFLKEEPERLESALRRCKKLTGTLVTLKRLASVQEQRLPDTRLSPTMDETPPVTPTSGKASGAGDVVGPSGGPGGVAGRGGLDASRPENALDALLDELQTFAKPPPPTGSSSTSTPTSAGGNFTLRRLHSYPSGDSGKPPVPERGADLLSKRVPPPPPPRTSSRSPLSSPTGPSVPPRGQSPLRRGRSSLKENSKSGGADPPLSSSCESVNSQEGVPGAQSRQEMLEQRHQELLRKQRALQEQYTRLQQLQRAPPPDLLQLKKTGSESNLLAKMGLGLSAAAPMSGSLSHLGPTTTPSTTTPTTSTSTSTTSKVYETDIL